jgi:RNA polymerase sigma factor (sigma-70 family)
MAGALAEDRHRLAELAASYRAAVRAYFKRRIGSTADADDLTQEVFLRLLHRADLGAIENPEGYIFQTAANVLRDRFRHDRRRIDLAGGELDDDMQALIEESSPERVLLGKEAYARMVRALQALPERTRMIFVLNRYELLSGREIAQRMGVSVSLVEKEMMRAIAHLRDCMR